MENRNFQNILWELLRMIAAFAVAVLAACLVMNRMIEISGIRETQAFSGELSARIRAVEDNMENLREEFLHSEGNQQTTGMYETLRGKKIVYDGDSIAVSKDSNGGGYPALIAELTGGTYVNCAKGGARLCSFSGKHSVVDNLVNLPTDGDLYCFEGGINDYWANTPLGEVDPKDYSGEYDTETVCGALETIFSYCLEHYPGKPVCFVIAHKVKKTAAAPNANGDTFEDYRNAMIRVCEKYSIPYYDAFSESGLNGWNPTQSERFMTGNSENAPDGIHPNAEGYKRYYVPQLIDLFQKLMPAE